MTDYWVFEFNYDRDDHGQDPLMEPCEALLAWWTACRQDVKGRVRGRSLTSGRPHLRAPVLRTRSWCGSRAWRRRG